ncbi:MAG: hypothetical protein AB7V40_00705 [Methyloceanibacter sp.]
MTAPAATPHAGKSGAPRLRATVLFIVYAELAFLAFLGAFLWWHADPKGDGMEMVGLGAAFMWILLPFTLPAWLLANRGRYLVTAAVLAVIAALLYVFLWFELLLELGLMQRPWI